MQTFDRSRAVEVEVLGERNFQLKRICATSRIIPGEPSCVGESHDTVSRSINGLGRLSRVDTFSWIASTLVGLDFVVAMGK
jgi:hypothetical protein